MDGVEPVERVREPARADDAADSDADAKSAGHFSDNEAMVEDAEDTTAAPQAGPSSLALAPLWSSSCAPSRASSVHSSLVHSPSALPASSPGAGPSTQPPGHLTQLGWRCVRRRTVYAAEASRSRAPTIPGRFLVLALGHFTEGYPLCLALRAVRRLRPPLHPGHRRSP